MRDAAISLSARSCAPGDPRGRPTPRVTIEALLHSVRERGLVALKEPDNLERLARCDEAALAEIDVRLAKLGGGR
jgi:hypothetical protein